MTENQYNKINEKFKRISRELFEEWKNKYPSHHTLKRCANEIITILKNAKIKDEEFDFWQSWQCTDLDIFIADLVGELYHDYDKRLVRYHGKWSNEKNKIESIISDFRTKFANKIE